MSERIYGHDAILVLEPGGIHIQKFLVPWFGETDAPKLDLDLIGQHLKDVPLLGRIDMLERTIEDQHRRLVELERAKHRRFR